MQFEFWERRLSAVIEGYSRLPGQWGKADCATFTADCVWALTQRDALAEYRGQYNSEMSAAKHIVRAGGLERLFAAGMEAAGITFQNIQPTFAQRGDPIVFVGPEGPTLGIVYGAEIITKSATGTHRRPLAGASVIACWGIR